MNAEAARTQWLEHLAHERRASPRTLEAYGFAAGRYIAFLERHQGEAVTVRSLSQVTAGELRAWLAHLRSGDRPLSPRSLSQALSAIRTFHKFLDRRLDAPNPAIALVRGPRVKPGAPRPITEDQAAGMLLEPGLDPDREGWEAARDQAVLTLLYGCGLRISEGLSLKRSDAPLGATLRITGKGSKTRIVPVLPAVRDAAVSREAWWSLEPAACPGDRTAIARPPGPAGQRDAACTSPLVRDPPAGCRCRSTLDPGTAGPCFIVDDAALHRGRRGSSAQRLLGCTPARLS